LITYTKRLKLNVDKSEIVWYIVITKNKKSYSLQPSPYGKNHLPLTVGVLHIKERKVNAYE